MSFANDWTVVDNPADHSKFKDQPSFIRRIRTDIEERIADLLYGFTSGETTIGVKQLPFANQAADPATPTDALVVFAKDSYSFTISGVTVVPTAGATYTNNGKTFTVLAASATKIYASGTGAPSSGNLVKATGTGDDTIAFSASTSTSELHVKTEGGAVIVLTSLGKLLAGCLTGLAELPAAAGLIPAANLPNPLVAVTALGNKTGAVTLLADVAQTMAATDNVTITMPSVSSGLLHSLVLDTSIATGKAITWPASVKWNFAATPSPTADGSTVNRYAFDTLDGGTNWMGFYGRR